MTYKEFASQINIEVDDPPSDCDMSREITVEDCIYLFNSLGRLIRHLQERSSWHTGTPTEEGWYLVTSGGNNSASYDIGKWDGESFCYMEYLDSADVVAWQKIEPPQEYDT